MYFSRSNRRGTKNVVARRNALWRSDAIGSY
jgi:hypothetical protein